MKVIFLDIDGVLIVEDDYLRSKQSPSKPRLDAINWLIEKTGAVVVVSSTWRIGAKVSDLQGLLTKWGVSCRVVGVTPDLNDATAYVSRGEEIAAWLEENPVESFVIIDDDDDMGRLSQFLVKTDFTNGLTMSRAADAADLLLNSVAME